MPRAVAFDLSSHIGWAAWDGTSPAPLLGPKRVLHWDRDEGFMLEEFRLWLGRFFDEHRPEVVAVEAPAMGAHSDSPTISRQNMIRGMVCWACHKLQLPRYDVPPSSWRKTFIGYGTKRVKKGEPKVNWKALAMQRCRVLEWDFQRDHNVAEAAGVLDHLLVDRLKVDVPWRARTELFLPLPEILDVPK